MIVDTDFIKRIRPLYKSETGKVFEVEYLDKIAGWITDYYDEYLQAPNSNMQDILDAKKSFMYRQEDSIKTYKLIKAFLEDLNERYVNGEYNRELLIQNATDYFRIRNWANFHAQMQGYITTSNLSALTRLHNEFTDVQGDLSANRAVTPQNMREMMNTSRNQRIVCFPGALGDHVGWFERSWLVGIMGPFKRGKSFWLQYLAHLCWEENLNVALVSLEMTERTLATRIARYVSQEPQPDSDVTERGMRRYTRLYGDRMRLFVYPCFSATIDMIYNDIIQEQQTSDWECDVLIIDHGDIVLHNEGSTREGLDAIWKSMKKIAEEQNWLVVTASQTNRQGTDRELITQLDTAEDIRKIAHCDCMLGLNQTQEERDNGIMRINVISHRHREFFQNRAVMVEQDLAISNPCRRSYVDRDR